MLHTHSAWWGGLLQPLQTSCALWPEGSETNQLTTWGFLIMRVCWHSQQLSSDWAARQIYSGSASWLRWWRSLWSSRSFQTRGASWQTWGWEETLPSADPWDQSNGHNCPNLPAEQEPLKSPPNVWGEILKGWFSFILFYKLWFSPPRA